MTTDTITQARQALASERDALAERLTHLDAALVALAALDGVTPAPVVKANGHEPRAAVNGVKRRRQVPATCPSCGRVFTNAAGLGAHRGGTKCPGRPAEPDRGAEADDLYSLGATPPRNGKVLACDDCDFTASPERLGDLRTHVRDAHKRVVTVAERTPTAA